MLTVIDAGALNGYSQTDHLIDDSEIKEIIGRQFRSVKQALAAADKRCLMETARGYRVHPYTFVEIRHADGSTATYHSV